MVVADRAKMSRMTCSLRHCRQFLLAGVLSLCLPGAQSACLVSAASVPRVAHRESWGIVRGGRGLERAGGLRLGLVARAKAPTPEELQALKVRKIARSVDQVIGSTLSGYCGPWVIGMIFGAIGSFKGGFKAAMRNGVTTGNSWGLMSAAFCGLEVLSREVRGTHDKWNNMVGACGAGAVGACGRGLPAMASGCVNFAGMSYLLDLLMERTTDPFEKAMQDPKSGEGIEGKVKTNKKKR